jgi:F0F1-type ATP synthase membrane subunit b/b'
MSHQAALDALGKMTRVLKAFEDVEVVLKALAGVEQNEREMRESLARSTAEAQAAKADLDELKAQVKKAREDAKKIEVAAQQKASEIVQAAQDQASQVHADALAAVDKAKATLASVNASVAEVETKRAEAQTALDSVNAALAEARQRVATMLG